ncbi:complex I subunit 5 family protein [Fusibacter ferrireducens]|uniref:Proton-conducting membrane transporter n=1 Tax=Fusibacter ferrireducens TaxID=2785058 RepID=A0ABR9ZUM4_9FIRM|nr:proton-conducting transporter membrane subunit [Fusibacter ferrireducens]MBF4694145.1 proton-conducting membrane transporter [Fusibacter ferrireducens]
MIFLVLGPILVGLFFYICHCKFLMKATLILEAVLIGIALNFLMSSAESSVQLLSGIAFPMGMKLRVDTLSATMLVLNNFLFGFMILFNMHKSYMNKLFIFLFLGLQGLINGVFLSTDFFNVYILIEVATVVVSILIMYKKDSQSMYDGMIYLMVNMIAMTFFLLGIGYLYKYTGALDFDNVAVSVETITSKKNLIMPFALMITGISLKAALLPLFSWLPKAHGTASAPSIVSGVLSGIFVKIGIYLFIRVYFIFGNIFILSNFFVGIGFLTAIAGFMFALAQTDIKLILAYHSISQIGLMMIGLSSAQTASYYGGLYHIVAHGIFKTLLFLIAGLLIETYHTRDIRKMNDLFRRSKFLSVILIIAVLSITGAPFFSGAYSKYYIMKGFSGIGFELLFILINMGTMMSFIKFWHVLFKDDQPFFAPMPSPIGKKILPYNSVIALSLMALSCILLGVAGDYMFKLLTTFDAHYGFLSQLVKWPKYLLTYAGSYLAYQAFVKKNPFFATVKKMELSFNQITLAILSFFIVTTLYLHFITA